MKTSHFKIDNAEVRFVAENAMMFDIFALFCNLYINDELVHRVFVSTSLIEHINETTGYIKPHGIEAKMINEKINNIAKDMKFHINRALLKDNCITEENVLTKFFYMNFPIDIQLED